MKIRLVLIVFAFLLLALYAAFIQQDDTITQAQAGYATLIVMLGALPGAVRPDRPAGSRPIAAHAAARSLLRAHLRVAGLFQ